jgi:hypothetical protein
MLTAIRGIYRDGKIELAEIPINVRAETPVVVTFLEPGYIDLRARGIDEAQAADLRARLATFVEDWESPDVIGSLPMIKVDVALRHTLGL